MKVRGICFSIVIAAVAVTPAAADDVARKLENKLPAQQAPAVTVACEIVEIWATHGKGGIDSEISKQLATRLTNNLKQTEYKQLSRTTKTLEKKKAETVKLKKGSAVLTFIELVDKAQIRLKVDFAAAKGTASAQPLFAGGDWVTVAANQSTNPKPDAHILAVSCK
jgi:NADH:ubiquinone oxidoreductase subunit C